MGRTFLAPVSYGLGDLVVSLPAVQALIIREPVVWLVARSASQRLLAERVAGLAGVVDEDTLRCGPGDRLIDLRDHPLQRDYWWGSPLFEAEFGGLGINDILERICADFGIAADFTAPIPLECRPPADLGRTVLLVHETDGTDKCWPAGRWAELAALLRDDGHDVARVVREDGPSPLALTAIPALVLPTPGAAVDALSGCRAVVGIDTGLTHLAVQQGTPTVAICRRSSVYVRPWPHCAALRGGDCTDDCMAAEATYAYNQTVSLQGFRARARGCPSGSPCLAGVRPEEAVARLRPLL
jgi:Glycosyltransferase family 9 (heptosyltransferase)